MFSNQEYHLIDDYSVTTKPKNIGKKQRLGKIIIGIIISIGICVGLVLYFEKKDNELKLVFIKGKSRKDAYGIELNRNILDGIYCMEYNNKVNEKTENNKLYTPPCPYLRPVHYPDSVLNPKCEKSTVQIVNFNSDGGAGIPYSLHLDSITNQMKKWDKWEKKHQNNTHYSHANVENLIYDDYYPFDYGYQGKDTSDIDDTEYYNDLIKSRMDEVPDPRRRRLFSFILFNTEFDLLDLYLSEYYEIFDYFVIYESNITFTGNPKPLHFTRALLETDRYDRFKDKLIPLPVNTIVNDDNGRGVGFSREHVARRLVMSEGLKSVHARHGDIFMHGDLDEMAKPHVLARLKKCGGWEHLQAGIGGGPVSFRKDKEKSKSYIYDPDVEVEKAGDGGYKVYYEKELSIGFESRSYEYSFNAIQNVTVGTVIHPNLAIFDARRSLGQFPERINRDINHKKRKELQEDPLLDPDFNPYQGYEYTDNTNDQKKGVGFIMEWVRFCTSKSFEQLKSAGMPILWAGGWHMSSFLPNIDHFYNKLSSYSHFRDIGIKSEKTIKEDVISRIKDKVYIFGGRTQYYDYELVLPESYKEGYQYNFDADYWDENTKNNGTDPEFQKYIHFLKHEVPHQVWKNPICYSFMIDRDFGINKKLWWEIIPKKEWSTVRFEKLDKNTLDKIIPPSISETYRKEMLESLSEETDALLKKEMKENNINN